MKHPLILIIFFLSSILSFSQTKKEIVYILFDKTSKEVCSVEDGSGNLLTIKKYREVDNNKVINFHVCNQKFVYKKETSKKDTCSTNILTRINLKDLNYLLQKYHENKEFKYQVFEKIFIVEKVSESIIVKYDVNWSGEWTIE